MHATPDIRGVVPRTVVLLQALSASPEACSSSDLGRELQIPVQTVHRLLTDLSAAGLTLQDQVSRRWTLGPLAIQLGRAASRQITLVRVGRPFLERLTDATRETTILAVRDGDHAVYADIVESPQPLRLTERVGMRLPLSVGSSRKVILAFLPESERDAIIHRLATGGAVADPDRLARECAGIARRGYAVSVGEVTAHTVGVSAPVFREGSPVGAAMVAGPEQRLGKPEIAQVAPLLLEHARAFSAVLSG